jgi:predicted nucleic acid-binding protein
VSTEAIDAPGLVLDTNAVLDWLVFRHPTCAAWSGWLEAGCVRLLASSAMHDELWHVLGRGVAAAWQPNPSHIDAAWVRCVRAVEPVTLAGSALRLRCTDPDDQKFIDLALGHGARWLVSRDRAVLKLAKRARLLGLEIVTPEAWTVAFSAR